MLKKIALGLVALIVVLVVVVALQPAEFTVERSTTIEAPPEVVYARIENLRLMDEWNPFAKMDPEMQTVYEGPEAGVGARSSWQGPQMGKGRIAIIAAKPEQEVEMKLEMLEPMAGTNRILFTLAPAGDGTAVTWRMDGRNGFVGKAVALFVGMDRMVGSEFEKGLVSLEALAEAAAKG